MAPMGNLPICLIAVVARNGVIGCAGGMPWQQPQRPHAPMPTSKLRTKLGNQADLRLPIVLHIRLEMIIICVGNSTL
jgi:hypothetical protein